jgi:geranylgeranyl pyrophosphate synthase
MPDASALVSFVDAMRTEVDDCLRRGLSPAPHCPAAVREGIRYSLFAGGKRFRPVITLAVADAVARHRGASTDAAVELALPAACAIEMIHTYSLIHDDLPAMDNDSLRRGHPTLHVIHGEALAILAGDGLHAEAFSLLAREPVSDDPITLQRKLRVIQLVADAAGPEGMVGGQALDLQAAGRILGPTTPVDADLLLLMHAGKTGSLIRAAAAAGAIMAGADEPVIAAIDNYARELGLAFQIVDDILDVEGDTSQLGKTAGKDAADAKPTYPSLFGLDESRTLAAGCVNRALVGLRDTGLTDGWLESMALWVLHRKN